MKLRVFLVALLSLVGACYGSGDPEDSATIEQTILWRLPVDPATWEPIGLKKLLHDPEKFIPKGNYFYKPMSPISVFGHDVLYVGAVGMGDVAGPNAMLKGRPAEIAKWITERYGVKFVKKGEGYHGDIKEAATAGGESYRVRIRDHVALVIAPNPEKEAESVVIGIYSGP